MSANYKLIINFLEKWPIDGSKIGRDLGERIRRDFVSHSNPTTIATASNTTHLSKQIESLKRISKNIYYSDYKRLNSSTATGLSAEECSRVSSSQFLQYLNNSNKNH